MVLLSETEPSLAVFLLGAYVHQNALSTFRLSKLEIREIEPCS